MRTSSGVVPHTLLGVLVLLSAGAIALSLVTAPPVAQEQLHLAARDTLAASSFVLADRVTVKEPRPTPALGGKSSITNTARIEYEAPDRILIQTVSAGRSMSLMVIGNNRYNKTDGGAWVKLPSVPQVGGTAGSEAAAELLAPLQSLAGATSVVASGSNYRFDPGDRASLLANLFGQSAEPLTSVSFSAAVRGEFVAAVRILADLSGARYVIDFGFLSVGSAPPIEAPTSP